MKKKIAPTLALVRSSTGLACALIWSQPEDPESSIEYAPPAGAVWRSRRVLIAGIEIDEREVMKQLLVYSDSLTWGIIPGTRNRLPFEARWPGVMERKLLESGQHVRVIEDCLNGRRTAFEDPYKAGRNGRVGLEQRIEVNSPLDLVILMLGTNDFQSMHAHKAWHSAQGIAALIDAVRRAPIEPGMPVPPILVVSPPPAEKPKGAIGPKFEGIEQHSHGLAAAFEAVAVERGCMFFDAGKVTGSSEVDGIHLDRDQHRILGCALADFVSSALPLPGSRKPS